MASVAREKWSLTQEAFDALLASFSPDRDTAAHRYLEIRAKLVRLFEWRGCPAPDDYADEAINRCARKIAEGEQIQDAATYCIGIARMLLREMSRDRAKEPRPLEAAPEPRSLPADRDLEAERLEDSLRRCLEQISAQNRDLILHYYQGDKSEKIRNRKALMERLRVPSGALRMRALRVRESLQLCAEHGLQQQRGIFW